MSLGAGLYGYLAPAEPAAAVLSIGRRIYPLVLPQKAVLPALVYQVIPAAGPLNTHSTVPGGPLFQEVRIQFSCWARSYADAEALGDELVAALNGYRGTWGSLAVGSVLMEGPQDDYDSTILAYRRMVDGLVQYQGGAP